MNCGHTRLLLRRWIAPCPLLRIDVQAVLLIVFSDRDIVAI
jgi:hypothetical protein